MVLFNKKNGIDVFVSEIDLIVDGDLRSICGGFWWVIVVVVI